MYSGGSFFFERYRFPWGYAGQEPEGCLLESDVDEVIPVSQKGSSEGVWSSVLEIYSVRGVEFARVC